MIELTEHRKTTNPKQLAATIAWLRKNGVRIALDDFGSGHSTFESVVNFDLDLIKMDKSFVTGIEYSDEKKIALESTLSLLETLNTPILCEGIETKNDVRIIKKMGVHYGQGYYYGKPMHFDVLQDGDSTNILYLKNYAHLKS
jgi:EAL domain-containing protein (putative c-di-GMP-specific phosphodiesterase class I)